jgi:uncharacterized protein YciI
MLFAVMGFFRLEANSEAVKLLPALNAHLGQPGLAIRLAGFLKDRHGNRAGLLVCLEADGFAATDAYLKESPFVEHDMYERVEVVEFCLEVGAGQLR